MARPMLLVLAGLLAAAAAADDGRGDGYDYYAANRQLIRNGVQAVLTCNGLFTSRRTLEQVFAQELAFLQERVLGDADGGPYTIDREQQAVTVGGGGHGPAVSAAFRRGIGCIVLQPGAPLAAIDELPALPAPDPAAATRRARIEVRARV